MHDPKNVNPFGVPPKPKKDGKDTPKEEPKEESKLSAQEAQEAKEAKEGPKNAPPMTIMSISMRTIVNHRENKTELLCVTARTWEGCKRLFYADVSSNLRS